MTIQIYWQLDPVAEPGRAEPAARQRGIGRDVRSATINRYDYHAQIARAAALTAFDGLLIRHRAEGDDSQIIAATLARGVSRLALVAEFPPSVGSAVYAAKQAVSFQRLAQGRLGWAIAPDPEAGERTRGADHVADDDLPARADEFLTVARAVHAGTGYTFKGRFFEVERGGFTDPLDRVAFPTVFGRGTGEEALALSAAHADVHLFDAAPLDALRRDVETLDAAAAARGRSVAFGVVQPVVARELAEDLAGLDIPPQAIAGAYDQVAERLAELTRLGLTHLVLAAEPSFEEAYRVGQFVLPRLRALADPVRAAA